MKRFAYTLTFLLVVFSSTAQSVFQRINWTLAWEDTFDSLNHAIWNIADYSDHYGDPQLYLKENVTTNNGLLYIIVNSDSADCPKYPPQAISGACGSCIEGRHTGTSGWIETNIDHTTQFGYIESRMKMPYKSFYWPAFWTFEHTNTPSNAGEIDIFEMLGNKPSNVITMNLHTEYPDLKSHYKEKKMKNFSYTDWHTYGVKWTEKDMVWYIDGKKVYKVSQHNITDSVRIIINLAINRWNKPPISAEYADTMFVDYVKVYKQVPTNELYRKSSDEITRNEKITPWRKPKRK